MMIQTSYMIYYNKGLALEYSLVTQALLKLIYKEREGQDVSDHYQAIQYRIRFQQVIPDLILLSLS